MVYVCVRDVMDGVFFSCRCCMFASCVHPVAVLNTAFLVVC